VNIQPAAHTHGTTELRVAGCLHIAVRAQRLFCPYQDLVFYSSYYAQAHLAWYAIVPKLLPMEFLIGNLPTEFLIVNVSTKFLIVNLLMVFLIVNLRAEFLIVNLPMEFLIVVAGSVSSEFDPSL